jgi:GTP-binding protein
VNLSQSIFKQSRTRVSTPRLNKALKNAMERNPPTVKKGKRLKIFYATQISTQPPTIVVKANDPTYLDEGWKRYLLTSLREQLPFKEIPIRLYFRGKSEKDDPDEKPKKQKRGGKKISERKARQEAKASREISE